MDVSGNSVDVSLVKNEVSVSPDLFGKGAKGSEFTNIIRKLVCDHQGSIIEHIYWAAEVHKDLRIALEDGDHTTLKVKINEIDDDLPALFQNAWRMTVNNLNAYFALSHKCNILPRMCIKATESRNGEQYIVDVFREDGGSSKLTYKVGENTGFYSVEKDGRYYRCNNIPDAIANNEYINPRLSNKLAKKYKLGVIDKIKKKVNHAWFDKQWAECWIDYNADKGNETSCYKSTLIVPMTLINNHQSSKFIQNTMVGVTSVRLNFSQIM